MFNTTQQKHICVFKRTNQLRIYRDYTAERLQQASICISCGVVEWKDIEVVVEGRE